MNKIKIEISPREFKNAIFKLPLQERIKFIEEMENEFFPSRFRNIVSILRSKIKKPLPLKKITKICKSVRKNLYEEETTRSN